MANTGRHRARQSLLQRPPLILGAGAAILTASLTALAVDRAVQHAPRPVHLVDASLSEREEGVSADVESSVATSGWVGR
jgi:hypothetical protein